LGCFEGGGGLEGTGAGLWGGGGGRGGRGADVGGWVGWGGARYHRLWERVVLELQDKLVLTARCDRACVQRECWSGIYGIVWGKG
jgi:hypothetical protein